MKNQKLDSAWENHNLLQFSTGPGLLVVDNILYKLVEKIKSSYEHLFLRIAQFHAKKVFAFNRMQESYIRLNVHLR